MKRILMLAGIGLVWAFGSGLAAREARPVAAGASATALYDAHLRYYEQIRPALIDATADLLAACGGERVARGARGEGTAGMREMSGPGG